MGNGVDGIAFFWFPEAAEGTPGESLHDAFDDRCAGARAVGVTAIGTMNHIAFDVSAEKIDEYLVKLRSKGVAVSEIINHANSLEGGHKPDYDPADRQRRRVRALALLQGPERHRCSSSPCWTTTFDESDIAHRGKTAADLTGPRQAVPA